MEQVHGVFFFFKQKTAYEIVDCDWSSDVCSSDLVMVDGAGLARKNLITPAALVDVLQIMARSPQADVFRESLAVAGQSGTLRNRWLDTPVEGQLSGKSGAISRNFAQIGRAHV